MNDRVPRPSPAMIVAMLALFVALGGVGLAASQLPKNSVGAKQIKTNGVRSAEIKDGAVGSADTADESLTGGDLQDGSVGGEDVQNGSLGGDDLGDESVGTVDILDGSLTGDDVQDESLTGDDVQDDSLGSSDVQGLAGDDVQSQTFLGGTVTVQFEQAASDLPSGQSASISVFCPAEQTAIGGGIRGDATNSELTKVTNTRPAISSGNTEPPGDNGSFTGWRGTVVNENNGTGIRPEAWVICASVPPSR
jgi:hypothetical protein